MISFPLSPFPFPLSSFLFPLKPFLLSLSFLVKKSGFSPVFYSGQTQSIIGIETAIINNSSGSPMRQ